MQSTATVQSPDAPSPTLADPIPAGGDERRAGGGAHAPTDGRRSSGRGALVVAALMIVVVVCGAALLIHRVDTERRDALTARVESRHAVAGQFLTAYITGLMQHERSLAASTMSGEVTPTQFDRINRENGYSAAVLLDADGVAIAVTPASPAMLGRQLGTSYLHLQGALDGRQTTSGVVASAVTGQSIVAFAVPFETPQGRRVFSAGAWIAETPLAPFIDNALAFATSRALLVDGAGIVIASSDPDVTPGRAVEQWPEVAAAAASGYHQVDGETMFTVAGPVDGTTWQLVFMVDTDELFAPVSGPGRLVPWGILAAFSTASLVALRMWRRARGERRSRLKYEGQLHDLAMSDSLTGLANRRLAVERLEQALGRAQRSHRPVAVVYIDVDDFKSINDRHGHGAGDAVLVEVAGRLRAIFRVEDTIARLGGDEFLIICEDLADDRRIDELAERTRLALAQPYRYGALIMRSGSSVGVTTSGGGEPVDVVLARADRQMYDAKALDRTLRASLVDRPAAAPTPS